MTLFDQIIDEAEELANNQVLLLDASNDTILDCVRDIVGVQFASNSNYAYLALAAYHRINNARYMIESTMPIGA